MDGARQIVVPGDRLAAVHLHRVRADVRARRRRRLSVPPDGRGGGVRDDRLLSSCRARWSRRWRTTCCAARRIMARDGHAMPTPSRNPSGALPAWTSNIGSSRCAAAIERLLEPRSACAGCSSSAFWSWSRPRSSLVPFLGQNFFPTVDGGQIKLHLRAQIGTRIEETGKLVRRGRGSDPADRPAPASRSTSSTTSACRSAASTWPTAIPAPSAPATPIS